MSEAQVRGSDDAAWAVVLRDYGQPPTLEMIERPLVELGPRQVRVRVSAAPINPSDIAFLAGNYGFRKALPVVPGFEGSGMVVASGASEEARALLGRRVAFAAGEGDGAWARFAVTGARACIPLLDSTDLEMAASMVINPTTAWALIDTVRDGGHTAFVHTAAGSSLGRMLGRLGRRMGLRIVHVVRRAAQVGAIEALEREPVLCSSDPSFDEQLRAACAEHHMTIALDAVGGPMTTRLLAALPSRGSVLVHGALDPTPCLVPQTELIFGQKRIEGFWLAAWLRALAPERLEAVRLNVQACLRDDLHTRIAARIPLSEVPVAILRESSQSAPEGKTLVCPAMG